MERGFFQSLFDFSFSSFVTVRLIKVIYALFIAASGFFALVFVASAFQASAVFGLFVLLIGAPVLFFFYVILARVYLELVVAIFRIAENTSVLAGKGPSLAASSSGSVTSPSPPRGPPSTPPPVPPPDPSPGPAPVDGPASAAPVPPLDQRAPEWADAETSSSPPMPGAETAPPLDAEVEDAPAPPLPEPESVSPGDETAEQVMAPLPPSPPRPRRRAPLRSRRAGSETPPEPPA